VQGDEQILSMWVVYDHPRDCPDGWLARKWVISRGFKKGMLATEQTIRAPTLAEVRALLPAGLYRIGRSYGDEPQIVESWI
jgi:hypothetical protein